MAATATAVTGTTSWLQAEDGLQLFRQRFKPAAAPSRAKLIFLHGYDHHSGMYSAFFHLLAQECIEIVGYDLRGFGQSVDHTVGVSGGNSGTTATTMNDLSTVISAETEAESESDPDIPLFLMGHSMGGAIVFTYASLGPAHLVNKITGWLGEAPDFGLPPDAPTKPSAIQLAILRSVHFFAPLIHITVKLDPALLCRDPTVQRAYLEDLLVTHRWSVDGVLVHLDRTAKLANGEYRPLSQVRSVWVGHGTEDRCTSFGKSREWFESLGVKDKEFKAYRGWRHNLHAEPGEDKLEFARDVSTWILRHI
ncbi:Alpha/Beta hydrolase protein [Aspergillus carlsbadensis]|nr:Alpha/Beta hydrolase protein [Aspergillus carlsbadensis]